MEFLLSIKLAIITLFFVLPFLIQGDPFCGNETSTGCNQTCYEGCMSRIAVEDLTDVDVKESIATQTNLCVNKCFGREFIPLMSLDIPDLPGYSNAVNCLGRCAYPAHTKYCLEGYLSSFLYCDCHQCCLQSGNYKKCIHGCHNWFLRQWSPKAAQGCRYRSEYMNSPKTYCTDFCIHAALKLDSSLSWNDIPNIVATKAQTCIQRCISLLLSGVPIGYDMAVVPCFDLTKCIEVSAFEFKVFVNYNLDETYIMAHTYLERLPKSFVQYNRLKNVKMVGTLENQTVRNEFFVRRAPALVKMDESGIRIFSEKGAENRVQNPQTVTILFPWNDMGHVLASAYNNTRQHYLDSIEGTNRFFQRDRDYFIEPCTKLTEEIDVVISRDVTIEHEVYVKISDTKGLFRLNAIELRNAISQIQEWNDLEFVRNFDDYTIVMKGKGQVSSWFAVDMKLEHRCEKIQNCTYPITPGATNLCRVNDSSVTHFGLP